MFACRPDYADPFFNEESYERPPHLYSEGIRSCPLSQKKAMDAMPGMQHGMENMQMGKMAQDDIAKKCE
jgi:hypothetical protein